MIQGQRGSPCLPLKHIIMAVKVWLDVEEKVVNRGDRTTSGSGQRAKDARLGRSTN